MALEAFLRGLDRNAPLREVMNGPRDAASFFELCDRVPETECKLAVHRADRAQDVRCFFVAQFSQGRIFIDLDGETVAKRVIAFSRFGVMRREVQWLHRLVFSAHVPRVLESSGDVLRLNYLGEPLRQHNLPADWSRQCIEIIANLRVAGCSHNDIKCDNLVVRDGIISLIDFGWATPLGAPVPSAWPEGLGAQHRLAVHHFDDAHAIRAACETAASGFVRPSVRMPAG